MLANFGFGTKWISWIKECVSTVRLSILVNGSPTKEFSSKKGIRQGDLLLPCLFILVAEALNILLKRARELRLLKGVIIRDNQVVFSHLQFADSSLLFCQVEVSEVLFLKRALRCFELASGLKINYHKSVLCRIDTSDSSLSEFASLLNCKTQKLPLNYLGLPLGASPRRKKTWKPIVDKLKLRLAGWKKENPIICRVPEGITKEIDQIHATFLWSDPDLKRKIQRMRFWHDKWCGDIYLKEEFPRLFGLSNEKESSLKDLAVNTTASQNWLLNFRRLLFEWENEELLRLIKSLQAAPVLNLAVKDSVMCGGRLFGWYLDLYKVCSTSGQGIAAGQLKEEFGVPFLWWLFGQFGARK
ncbi:uncharacterized protein LOC114281552 [Camellia sinensis]|uniref:uncharacterized protein LOC114281552 n=1 Tax=Camellia sinensis TaxID=4442 RepID=UPI001036ACF2|nr:uncharacterized protein LOC114281552 [Camellia sinensis]